ncbi:MAG: DUF507 family protein [Thermoanaerobaculia bacterium]
MQRVSRERQTQLARAIVDEMGRDRSIRLLKDREAIRQSVLHALGEELKRDEERTAAAERRLLDADPRLEIGSAEWDELFERMLSEEYDRHATES